MHQKCGVYIVININGAVLGSGISSRKEPALQRKYKHVPAYKQKPI